MRSLLLLLPLLAGCVSTIDGARGFPPFYEELKFKAEDGSERLRWSIGPIFSREDGEGFSETRALWPLLLHRKEERRERRWLLPFYHDLTYHHRDGRVDRDGFVLPFYFYGRDSIEGDYDLFFPIGGTLKGIFGKDHIDITLFPLYTRLVDREQVSTHVMFPFYNRSEGPLIQGSRLWPLWSDYEGFTADGRKRFERTSYLWPFYHRQRNRLDSDNPEEVSWFWPLYGEVKSNDRIQKSFLWPLWTEEIAGDYHSWKLFPFTFAHDGNEWVQYQLWPIYGHKKMDRISRTFVLWPFIGWETAGEGKTEIQSSWLIPLYHNIRRTNVATGEFDEVKRSWPLWRWRSNSAGRRSLSILDLSPLLDEDGIEQSYKRSYQLIRWVGDGGGGWSFELLWGLLSVEKKQQGASFSLLGGLIASEAHDSPTGGDRRWRLLYIPLSE